MLGDFADVQQSICSGENFDERAELREAHDFAKISLADFGAGSDFANHGESCVARSATGREDVHGAIFKDVDFDASLFRDGLDFLSARADEVADFVRGDVQLVK